MGTTYRFTVCRPGQPPGKSCVEQDDLGPLRLRTGIRDKETTAQRLMEVIDSYKVALGETEEGRNWSLKALHPSDPICEVTGVPDQTSCPTTFLNWQQQATVTNPSQGVWEATITFFADPSVFAHVVTTAPDGTGVVAYNIINTAYDGIGLPVQIAAENFLHSGFTRWRLGYAGLTVHCDGPSLANQGSVVAGQATVEPEVGLALVMDPQFVAPHKGVHYNTLQDQPTYSRLLSLPNAYTGLAKDGVYMPLRLDSNHAQWHSMNDQVFDLTCLPIGVPGGYQLPVAPQRGTWPYHDIDVVYQDAVGIHGTSHLLPMVPTFGTIAFKNLGPEVNLNLSFRVGCETQVAPSSSYMPYVRVSPAYDPTALSTYFRISRELKDAYPADYNDLGKLWSVIKGAASVIAPFAKSLPFGGLITGAAGSLGSLIDKSLAMRKAGGKQAPGAAEIQRERQMISRALQAPPPSRKQKKKRKPRKRQ